MKTEYEVWILDDDGDAEWFSASDTIGEAATYAAQAVMDGSAKSQIVRVDRTVEWEVTRGELPK